MRGTKRPHVAVVGAGVVGSWIAYELARAGCRVTVLDADPLDSQQSASFGNAGILAQSYAVPMSNPRMLWAGIRSVLGPGHDVELVRPLSKATLRWILQFGYESRPGRAYAAAALIYAVAKRSVEMYEELGLRENVDLQLRRTGWLYVAHTSPALRQQQALASRLRDLGVRSSFIDADGLGELEPSLDRSLAGGVLFHDDISMDPGRVTRSVRDAARRHGADFVQGRVASAWIQDDYVRGLLTEAGDVVEADQFVIAAGAWSASVGKIMDVRIAVEPGVGSSLTIPTDRQLANTALMGIEDHVVINPGPRSVRITGGMRFGGTPGSAPSAGKVNELRAAAERILPALAEEPHLAGRGWTGARPMTASGLPIVGRANSTTVIATGHGTLGMTLAPHTAESVRRLLVENVP